MKIGMSKTKAWYVGKVECIGDKAFIHTMAGKIVSVLPCTIRSAHGVQWDKDKFERRRFLESMVKQQIP